MRISLFKDNILATRRRLFQNICSARLRQKQQGQTVLEFIVVSSSIIFFIFMFVNLCYVFLIGEYIDYSVFMASRTLYAGHSAYEGTCSTRGSPQSTQQCYAQFALERMLRIDSGGVFGPLVKFKTTSAQAVQAQAVYPNPKRKRGDNLVSGVKVEYDVPMFLIPPLGILKSEDVSRITNVRVVSESYLDREPSQNDCYDRLMQIIENWFPAGHLNVNQAHAESSDNGC